MNPKEIEKLKEIYLKRFKDAEMDPQTFDFTFENDFEGLTYEEALNELNEKLDVLIPTDVDVKEVKNNDSKHKMEEQNFKEELKQKSMIEDGRGQMFEEQANVLVIGKKRSGKTCLAWTLLKQFGEHDRNMFVYRYPKPEELEDLPFEVTNLTSLKQLSNLRNAVILIDESDRQFPTMEKAVNSQLRGILSLSGQNNICFIFVCHSSYFINRSLFSFIDIKVIKETNDGQWELERPYMKKLYENIVVMGHSNFFIDCDYHRGLETFEKPDWFTDKLSFAYRNDIKEDFFKKMNEKKCEK